MTKNKTSSRNKLIKKWAEHANWKKYKFALGKKQRGKGIYVLYKGDKIYYIGRSGSSLRSRIKKHSLKDRHKRKWDNFSFYQILKTKYIGDIERLLLRIYKPKGNINLGRFKRKYKLRI